MTRAEYNATTYLSTLRTPAKRAFAARYLEWVIDGRRGPEPDHPKISAMAAQAVRMNLHKRLND